MLFNESVTLLKKEIEFYQNVTSDTSCFKYFISFRGLYTVLNSNEILQDHEVS